MFPKVAIHWKCTDIEYIVHTYIETLLNSIWQNQLQYLYTFLEQVHLEFADFKSAAKSVNIPSKI